MNRRLALIAAVLMLGAATVLPAQTIRGTVVDSATAQALASVSVELTDTASQVVARASTDEAGRYVLQAPAPGAYRLRVQRIGYQPFDSPMVLNARGDLTLPLRLSAVPVQLAPVSVEAAQDEFLRNRGYYMRKESEAGTFLDPVTVEKLAPKARLVADILDHIPGVTIVIASGSGGGRGVRVPQLRGCRPGGLGVGGGRGTMAEQSAFPRMYVDGVEVGREILGALQPTDILAVEVYRGPAQIPLQYGGTNTPCGVIMIWTKH